jgi:hypothetical protein
LESHPKVQLGENLLLSSKRCWLDSVPFRLLNVVSWFLLAVGQSPLSVDCQGLVPPLSHNMTSCFIKASKGGGLSLRQKSHLSNIVTEVPSLYLCKFLVLLKGRNYTKV